MRSTRQRQPRLPRKNSAALVALVASTSLLVACSSTPDGDGPSEEPADSPGDATEEPAEAWVPDQNMRLYVPYAPGGGGDAYARALAQCFDGQLSGGVNVVVENRPPAVDAISTLWRAEPDGLTIGYTPLPAIIGLQLSQPDAVPWESSEFEPIGVVESNGYALYVRADSEYQSVDDLQAASGLKTMETDPGSSASLASSVAIVALDLDAVQIYGAESSADGALALMRGEADFIASGVSDFPDLIESGDLKAIMFLGTDDQRPSEYDWIADVPGFEDFGAGDFAGAVSEYRLFSAPPGTPEDRLSTLRAMFTEAMDSGCMEDWSEESGRPLLPLDAEAAEETLQRQVRVMNELFPLFESIQTQ